MKSLSASLLVLVLATGCADKPADYFPGYAEAEYVRLATPIAGTLSKLHVQRGDAVQADAPAFVLEQESERAAREEAASRVQRAEAQLANLNKGRRPEEVAAVRAQLTQAEAALRLSNSTYARQKQLVEDRFISPASLDQARSGVDRDQARVNELRAQLRVANLAARPDEIAAAAQELKAAQAQLAQAEWRLAQKTQRIPVAGNVADVLYREGEYVQAGSPVVSVLPPQNIKLRFFVPEPQFAALRLGQDVVVQCDGCQAPVPAKISYLSSAPEYTSPLIYSKENRAALVFMIEARPAAGQAALLHPGQPVEIRLAQGK
ncbi:HlyD family secretion protein [Noviherbaspirillum sp.]|uniref:HlyD family secretion protein n=1 Tax=Noviherbaspirillum sp. TaxID=1926288 RepID=UPI002D3F2ABD|nr:HlyD family efflux transporter periplasmic adaptor subunit [Noviherbaspirillum sp.]HZW20417.1 HlyD family efflux transporter periplasmic adaptor subunit [Noviherbaspirillum sp.]